MGLDIVYFSLEVLFIIYRQTEIAWQVENIGEIQTHQRPFCPIFLSVECISVEILIAQETYCRFPATYLMPVVGIQNEGVVVSVVYHLVDNCIRFAGINGYVRIQRVFGEGIRQTDKQLFPIKGIADAIFCGRAQIQIALAVVETVDVRNGGVQIRI